MTRQPESLTPRGDQPASATRVRSLYGRDVPGERATWAAMPRRPRFRAQLYGGRASGWSVELPDLVSEIAVYLKDADVIVVDNELPSRGHRGQLLGVYRLVEAAGPDVPRYIGTAWS